MTAAFNDCSSPEPLELPVPDELELVVVELALNPPAAAIPLGTSRRIPTTIEGKAEPLPKRE